MSTFEKHLAGRKPAGGSSDLFVVKSGEFMKGGKCSQPEQIFPGAGRQGSDGS